MKAYFLIIFCTFPLFRPQEILDLRSILGEKGQDPDLVKLASEDMDFVLSERENLQRKILQNLIPRDEAENRGCVLEVRAGASFGGVLGAI